MGDIQKVMHELDLESQIKLEDIPQVDLYMDQVIQLFESKFGSSKRTDDEKILTKTMINNYAKGKLFIPIKNKKYTKEHLILISLIYQLKGALSIGDIKTVLNGLNEKLLTGDCDLAAVYGRYLDLAGSNAADFQTDLQVRVQEVSRQTEEIECGDAAYIDQLLLIASLANMSNLYRRVAEKLVDELADGIKK